jgi:hypothetical protein
MAVLVLDDLDTWILIIESPFSKRLFPYSIAVNRAEDLEVAILAEKDSAPEK